MRKKVLILISIVLMLFLFKSFYDDSVVERKINDICELIRVGDSYSDVLHSMSTAILNEENMTLVEKTNTDNLYSYIVIHYPIDSMFYPQEYICTVKFSDSVVVESFVKFID